MARPFDQDVMVFSKPVTVVLDVAAWAVIHASTGYLVHRLSLRRFERDSGLTRARRFERDGEFYVGALRIKRWKGLLPEAGDLFSGGFNKKRLTATSEAHLARYAAETRRAELGHWLAAAFAPLFFLWNPCWVGVFMVVYAVAVNGPCIAAQRYNRIRLVRIESRRRRKGSPGS